MLSQAQRTTILELSRQGMGKREIGRALQISRASVRRVLRSQATEEWPNFLGNRPMVEALLSRLRHYCHTVRIDGPSLRDPQG
jgi:transposase